MNAYAKMGDSSPCCGSQGKASKELQVVSCCSSPKPESSAFHSSLTDLLRRYDVNDYAASVNVYAVKPR